MTARTIAHTHSRIAPAVALLAWLSLAIVAGATGDIRRVPQPGPQLIIVVLAVSTVLATTLIPRLRVLVDGADLRWLAAPHVLRFVGFVFLALAARGEMSPLFARNAGVGDIISATLALALILAGPPRTALRRGLWLAWSVIGLLDFAIVLGTARYVALHDPGSLAVLFQVPLVIVPLFAVPLLIALHVITIRRLLTERAQ